jgi:hypothetical protein
MSGLMPVQPHLGAQADDELQQAGFTNEEIDRLRRLREMYPYLEYVDSRRQWHRLRFVKWLYTQGQIQK